MPKLTLVANWKNHPDSLTGVNHIISGLVKKSVLYKKINLFVAPPTAYLELVSKKIKKLGSLAVQDVPLMFDGTHTGELSFDILKSFGVRMSIVGHSERRALGETNEVVNHKVRNALRAGITPVLCVGEKEVDHSGEHLEFIREQLVGSLYKVTKKEDIAKIMIAYEPVWAIGKSAKDAMKPSDIEQTIIFIRKILSDMYTRVLADKIPIIYGGSVEPTNAEAILKAGVSGFLVGHASLDAENFYKIAQTLNK